MIRSHTAEHVKLTSFDGLHLSALYLPAQGESQGTVVAFHGYRSLATIDFALEAELFHGLGYELLLPYQRSHGESQGKYITYGVKERFDCRDWARYAARRFGQDKPLFLMGISMGAATVLMASDWICRKTPGALWRTADLPPPGTSWPMWPSGITACPLSRCCTCWTG